MLINIVFLSATPSRDHVFQISFPSTWKQSDIINHFRNYGRIYVSWIDECSAFVALQDRVNAPILLKSIGYTQSVKIQSFNAYIDSKTKVEYYTFIYAITRLLLLKLKEKVNDLPPLTLSKWFRNIFERGMKMVESEYWYTQI